MLRDNKNEARHLTLAERWSRLRIPERAEAYRRTWRDLGLPAKLLMLTAVFVLLAEVLIFLPSVSTFRVDWLNERLTAAQLATLAAEGFPGGDVPSGLRAEMLRTAQVKAIASRRQGVRRLVLPVDPQMTIDAHYDLRQKPENLWDSIGVRLEQIGDAIAVFFAPDGRTIRVLGSIGDDPDDLVEIVMPEAPLEGGLDLLRSQHPWRFHRHLADHRRARLFRAEPVAGAPDDAHHARHGALSRRTPRIRRVSSFRPAATMRSAWPSASSAKCSGSFPALCCRRRGSRSSGSR